MNMEDEIKQINEIINKLDIIQDEDWQQKEGETEEEYNDRIESIEEELEEELLDYISDSLLAEQEINEEEAVKEAQEKIKSDYELFSDAFVENEDGTITIKSKEELASLGYSTPEEIEKLKEIENNINAPEQYLNKIKENVKASKDIDSEIDRKMELAKSIISAKKRGETLLSSLNSTVEKDKFEKANEYIANTTTLKRIPVIQNEYINNNYISERRYNNVIRNINNTTDRSNSRNSVTATATTTQMVTPVVSIPAQRLVTKRIPERKNEVYTNFEKKLDKDNDLTKQKIKARTELKSIFKEVESKELTKEELNELNSKIESIKKKYPNTVTDKTLDKLYDTFKVKLPTKEVEQQPNNTESTKQADETESNVTKNPKMSKEELMEALKKAEAHSTEYTHANGINVLVINKLICYLKDNDDREIQERLNKEIAKLQTDRYEDTDKLYIYNYGITYPKTLNYMYQCYKNGEKSTDGSRDIIPANQNVASYYLYLTCNNIQRFSERKDSAQQKLNNDIKNGFTVFIEGDKQTLKELEEIEKGWELESGFIKKIYEDFNTNKEETCYRYFEFLKGKYNIDKLKGIERLKAEDSFINELKQAKYMPCNTEYLDLAISKEFISRIGEDDKDFIHKIQTIEKKNKRREKINPRVLKLVGDIYYNGIKSASDQEIMKQDKRKAIKIYEQIINGKEISNDAEIYGNLIEIYSDNTTPLYNKAKADKLLETATKKGIHIQRKSTNPPSIEPYTYVCGDLHGEYPVYQAIVNQLKEKDKLYILGDVIDKGPDGIKILQDVMKRKEQGQVEFLIGNHELMMIQSLFFNDKITKANWEENNDGDITRKAFEELSFDEQNRIKEFLLNSYVYKNINVNSQNIHLVHAKSIQDKNDNSDKTVREMIAEKKEELMSEALCERNPSSSGESHSKSAKSGKFTVIGHTTTRDNMVKYKNGYLDIDCGAGSNKIASLVNLTNGTVKYISVTREREKEKNKPKER